MLGKWWVPQGCSLLLTAVGQERMSNTDVYFSKPRGCLWVASKEPGCLEAPAWPRPPHLPQPAPSFLLGSLESPDPRGTKPSCFSRCWSCLGAGPSCAWCTSHTATLHRLKGDSGPGDSIQAAGWTDDAWVLLSSEIWRGRGHTLGLQVVAGRVSMV